LCLVLVALYLRAYRHVVQARGVIAVYLVAEGLAALLWLAGAFAPAPLRYLCWALAVASEAAAPILATARSAGLPLHLEHLPERFGLLIILVLGESVAAVAVGVHDTHWDPTTVTAAILAFVVAAGLWWTYFDLTGAATTHALSQRAGHRTTPLHDIYAYGHWPIALGLTAAGVGLEEAILHANQPSLSTAARWILCGGIALYLLSLTAIQGGIAGSLRSILPWPTIGVPLILAVGLASRFHPAVVLSAVGLILLGEVATGLTDQRQGMSTRTAPKDRP
jgi:low temperature requirement protein LtrA